MKIVTIISANYMAYAKTLAASVENAGHGKLLALIADRKPEKSGKFDDGINFEIIYAEDIGIKNFYQLAFKYDITEFNTALKPFFLEYILNSVDDQVVYLDPDIFLYQHLFPIEDAFQRSSILLTPHSTTPIMDGLRPSDVDFLRTGTFNLGFIAVKNSAEVHRFLAWWKSRCELLCFNDTAFGTFVDQKWIDLVLCYFNEVEVLKDSGLNVAYWNIHERILTKKDGIYLSNNVPLYFFHYSGIDVNRPNELSKHQTRTSLSTNVVLKEIFDNYILKLNQNSVSIFLKMSYGYGSFSNGELINTLARRALVIFGEEVQDPFDCKGDFYGVLKKSGLLSGDVAGVGSVNTLKFNKYKKQAKFVNMIIRLISYIFGIDRTFKLMKYLSLSVRESHFQSIILKKEINFSHPRE